MLQGALIKFDKTSSYEKRIVTETIDNVYSCTRNSSPKRNMDCQ